MEGYHYTEYQVRNKKNNQTRHTKNEQHKKGEGTPRTFTYLCGKEPRVPYTWLKLRSKTLLLWDNQQALRKKQGKKRKTDLWSLN